MTYRYKAHAPSFAIFINICIFLIEYNGNNNTIIMIETHCIENVLPKSDIFEVEGRESTPKRMKTN